MPKAPSIRSHSLISRASIYYCSSIHSTSHLCAQLRLWNSHRKPSNSENTTVKFWDAQLILCSPMQNIPRNPKQMGDSGDWISIYSQISPNKYPQTMEYSLRVELHLEAHSSLTPPRTLDTFQSMIYQWAGIPIHLSKEC